MKRILTLLLSSVLTFTAACTTAARHPRGAEHHVAWIDSADVPYTVEDLLVNDAIQGISCSNGSVYYTTSDNAVYSVTTHGSELRYQSGNAVIAIYADSTGLLLLESSDVGTALVRLPKDGAAPMVMNSGALGAGEVGIKLRTDSANNIYLQYYDEGENRVNLRTLDSDGTMITDGDFDGTVFDIARSADGSVYASEIIHSLSELQHRILVIDNNASVESVIWTPPFTQLIDGDDSYQVYLRNDLSISGLDFSGDLLRTLVTLTDIGLGNVQSISPLGENSEFLVLRNSTRISLVVKSDTIPNRIELKLAAFKPSGETLSLVNEFNASNGQYMIKLVDYSQSGESSDSLSKLLTEIVSGDAPDIFDLGATNSGVRGMPLEKLITRGYLEDLYKYLDGDAELERSDISPNVLTALEHNGAIYEAFSFYRITTFVGLAETFGFKQTWSIGDLLALQRAIEPLPQIVAGKSRLDLVNLLGRFAYSDYIDWKSGTCNFDSPEFHELLRALRNSPENPDSISEAPSVLLNNDALLANYFISDPLHISAYRKSLGDFSIVGFPGNSGNGNYIIRPASVFAISSTGKYKDACWSFVRTVFTENYQDKIGNRKSSLPSIVYINNIPTNTAVFESKIRWICDRDATETQTVTIGGQVVTVGAIPSDSDISEFREVVDSTTRMMYENDVITDIILEETAAYFAGDKSAEECARVIQSRASLYVGEQR
jgi:ABC-type glycerol-3-phosphate transport system substrate-binding protein